MNDIKLNDLVVGWNDWHDKISHRITEEMSGNPKWGVSVSYIHQSTRWQHASIDALFKAKLVPQASPIIRIHFEHLALFCVLLLTDKNEEIHQDFTTTIGDEKCSDFYWKNYSNQKKLVYRRLGELHDQLYHEHGKTIEFPAVNYKQKAKEQGLRLGKYVHPSLILGHEASLNRRSIEMMITESEKGNSLVKPTQLASMQQDGIKIENKVIYEFLQLHKLFSKPIIFKYFDDPEIVDAHTSILEKTEIFESIYFTFE